MANELGVIAISKQRLSVLRARTKVNKVFSRGTSQGNIRGHGFTETR